MVHGLEVPDVGAVNAIPRSAHCRPGSPAVTPAIAVRFVTSLGGSLYLEQVPHQYSARYASRCVYETGIYFPVRAPKLGRGPPRQRRSDASRSSSLPARGETSAAFYRRCIPPDYATRRPTRSCPGYGQVSPKPWRRRIASRSHAAGTLPRRTLPDGRIASLGATPDYHDGLLGSERSRLLAETMRRHAEGRRRARAPQLGPGLPGPELGAVHGSGRLRLPGWPL